MLIDHIGIRSAEYYHNLFPDYDSYITYNILRCIGRIAFPIFCYQLVESFYYTKDRKKHLLKILGLAVISEIPYNLMHGNWLDISRQNVCFSLAIGFACIWISHLITKKINLVLIYGIHVNRIVKFLLQILNVAVFAFLAFLIKADYSYAGILMIAFMNFAKKYDMKSLFLLAFVLLFVLKQHIGFIFIFADILIIRCFLKSDKIDEEQKDSILTSKPARIISSFFYPVHLLILTVFF